METSTIRRMENSEAVVGVARTRRSAVVVGAMVGTSGYLLDIFLSADQSRILEVKYQ